MRKPYSLYQWAALQPIKPPTDFKALSGQEVWKRICEQQMVIITKLYHTWEDGEDPEEIRFLAHEQCPGLIDLWTEPYHMKYTCADGPLTLSFHVLEDGSLEVQASLSDD